MAMYTYVIIIITIASYMMKINSTWIEVGTDPDLLLRYLMLKIIAPTMEK